MRHPRPDAKVYQGVIRNWRWQGMTDGGAEFHYDEFKTCSDINQTEVSGAPDRFRHAPQWQILTTSGSPAATTRNPSHWQLAVLSMMRLRTINSSRAAASFGGRDDLDLDQHIGPDQPGHDLQHEGRPHVAQYLAADLGVGLNVFRVGQ
jgi:hypothetical protein